MSEIPRRSILIVEDEALVAMDLEASFGEAGFRVIGPAWAVSDALSLLRDERPDVAILDLSLGPELSFPLFDYLEKTETPFVIMSGHSSRLVPERHRNRPFVQKPFQFPVLLRTIYNALNESGDMPACVAG